MNQFLSLTKLPRRALMAVLCAAAAGSFAQDDSSRSRTQTPEMPAAAEPSPGLPGANTDGPALPPGPLGRLKPVRLACCHCLGEAVGPINISTGQPVPWTVNGVPASNLITYPGWAPPAAGAGWIGPANGTTGASPGTYKYELKIDVPRCVIPGTMTISGQFWADNKGTVTLLGPAAPPPAGAPPGPVSTLGGMYGFKPSNDGKFTYTVLNAGGIYTLTVMTQNESGPTGMLMNATVTKRCVTEPIGRGLPSDPASSSN